MKKLSRFDISIIIAFVIIALIGGGAAYYLDAYQLADAQNDVQAANDDFQQYSSKMVFLPTRENLKILQGNIDLIHTQLDPMVKDHLQAPGNKLADIVTKNTVDWKRDLDDNVAKLNAAAKAHNVQVPDSYYYSFSYFLSNAPSEENTAVLSKQLLAIEEIVNILIGAPVDAITSIRRTSEGAGAKDSELLPGHSVEIAGGLYTAYPLEIEFDTTTNALRKVVNDLMQSPYVFIIRSISVQNNHPTSPQLGDLDKIAGAQAQSSASVTDSPGAVAETKSTAGPQYLFGGETLHVRMRIDFIEWKGLPSDAANAGETPAPNPASPTGN
ncbi:MAG: Amuc_1100 family pilus-like protein [Methylacidiphilales bacterium]|nr:Amuc_1100 family pilus-like protein [Candidatus Methylacidiphilales bacterium]